MHYFIHCCILTILLNRRYTMEMKKKSVVDSANASGTQALALRGLSNPEKPLKKKK